MDRSIKKIPGISFAEYSFWREEMKRGRIGEEERGRGGVREMKKAPYFI
jgi:hypothetical protein